MAAKQLLTTDAAAKKLYAARSSQEWTWKALFSLPSWGFMSKGNSTMFKENVEFKEYGDEITETFFRQLTKKGTVGGAAIEGTETSPLHFTFKYIIEELTSPPFGLRSKMDDQRIETDLYKNGKEAVRKWWGPILNVGPMAHLAGYTANVPADYYRPALREIVMGAQNGFGHQWSCLNPVQAPTEAADDSTRRIIRGGVTPSLPFGVAGDELLVTEADHKMTSLLIEELIATAQQTIPAIEPCKWAGGEHYMLFLHTDQWNDLRKDSQFDAINLATLQGGEAFEGNPVATGNVRPFLGTILIVSNWNPPGVDIATNLPVANTRRAVFVGAQAMAMGWGVGESQNRFRFHKESYNIGGSQRCVARSIFGGAKVRFDRGDGLQTDHGVYVCSTYARNRGDTGNFPQP